MFSIRNILPKTLLARFMMIIIIPTLIGQILAIFLFYDRHWYNVSYYTSNLITNEINSLLTNLDSGSSQKLSINEDYLNFTYQFQPDEVLPRKQPRISEELEIFKNILDNKITLKKIVKLNLEGKIEVLFAFQGGVLKIFFPAKLLMNPTTYIFILWLIFLTLILLSVSLIFGKKQIKSILELTTAADNFGKGLKTALSYKPSGAREIRRAGLAFLRMKERIEKQVLKRTQMLAMISHDLRTPLTRMKLQLEMMPDGEEVFELKQDVLSMQQMINSYLDFTRGEGGEEFQIFEITKWLRDLIKAKWSSLNCEWSMVDQPINVQIKPHSFERAIVNIIDNAIKYSTKIKISVYSDSLGANIAIEDNGPGIIDSEKNMVFKPFYRSDQSRSLDNSSSIGLGLAITREIINGHYGSIILEDSRELGGLMIKLNLPII
jgi:two-component system osmolarity sensor histidine kinase EnvZ